MTLEQRLLLRLEPELNSGCWLWWGYVDRHGYGHIRKDGRALLAHRVAYRLWRGEPEALHVCHRCDTPACCNPDHLFLGTHADNMRDMTAKGRNPSSRPHCKHGHPFSGDNLVIRPDGKRKCRSCERAKWAAKYLRQKERAQRQAAPSAA